MTKNQQYLNYVRHIASLFSGDQQPEDAELVLDNAFSELRGHELEVFQDRDGSAQLEVLLHHSHVSHLTALVEPLLQSANIATWFELMSNVFASHVIDAVFNQLQHCMTDYHVTDADYQSGLNLVRQIVTCMTDAEHRTVLAEHWRQLLTSKYGSYTLRHTYALVHTLLKHATKKGNRKAQTALTNQLSALLTALTWSTDSKYLIDMCHHEATAHVIELVLEIAAESGAEIQRDDHVTESSYLWLVDTLLSSETSSDEEHVTEILKRMKHAVWSHVMIALIKHVTALKSNQKWNWSVLYQKYFRTRLVALCAHPVANFVVQSLIATSSTEPHWRMLFTEMEPQFSELLDGRLGVVLNLLNSSVTHVNAQSELIKAVVRVLSSLVTKDLTAKNGKEPDSNALVQETRKQIASLLLHLKNTPRHQYKKQSRDGGAGDSAAKNSFGQYSGIGCQLLSALFQLQHEVNQFVLKSFAQLGKDEHVKMCKDHQASHVIEHFLTSRHVPLNLKQNFIESLKGSFAELAQDKYGSHCVDKCYQNSELSKKEMITKELLKHERELNASFYGKHVLKNCRAEQYKKKRDVWRSKEQQNEKTRERFADILAAPTEDEHVEEKKESHVTESAAPNTESRGTKRKRKESVTGVKEESVTGVKEESVTGVKEESAEDDIDRVFKKIKPNPRDDDEREEVTLTPVIQESVSDARLDNIVAALKKTKSKKKK